MSPANLNPCAEAPRSELEQTAMQLSLELANVRRQRETLRHASKALVSKLVPMLKDHDHFDQELADVIRAIEAIEIAVAAPTETEQIEAPAKKEVFNPASGEWEPTEADEAVQRWHYALSFSGASHTPDLQTLIIDEKLRVGQIIERARAKFYEPDSDIVGFLTVDVLKQIILDDLGRDLSETFEPSTEQIQQIGRAIVETVNQFDDKFGFVQFVDREMYVVTKKDMQDVLEGDK